MADSHQEGDRKPSASERQADRVEQKSEPKARGEAGHDLGAIGAKVKDIRLKQYESGNSGASGIGDKNGKFRSAKDILGDAVHKPQTKETQAKRESEFKSKHGDPNELQGMQAEHQGRSEQAPENKPEPAKHEPPHLERAKEAAGKMLETVTAGGLYERGSLQGIKDNPITGVPTVLGKDGVRRLDGHFQPEPHDEVKLFNAVGKVIEPGANAVSRFNTESTKALHNLMEDGKEAVGLHPHVSKPVHAATGDGSTLPKPIKNPGDAAHLGIGATTGFTKAVNDMMPGITPRGAIEVATQAAKQAAALAQAHSEHEANMHKNPIGTVLHDAMTAGKMYNGAVDWANHRSQTESFAERGHDIGKTSPDIMMLSEIVFIAKSGKLITPRDATRLHLETKTSEELDRLGIKRTVADKIKPEDMVNPIDRNATPQEKVRQLEKLSAENEPLVRDFTKQIDGKFGTKSSEPNLKDEKDILAKAERPEIKEKKGEWFGVEHIRDSLRFKTPVDDLNLLPAIAKELKQSGFQVINPDVDKLLSPKGRGWRMAAFDLRSPNGQIIEYQVLPKEMNEAGKMEHSIYKGVREKDVRTMTMAEQIEKWRADKEARNLYQTAWESYLKRTGQSEEEIQKAVEAAKRILEEEQR